MLSAAVISLGVVALVFGAEFSDEVFGFVAGFFTLAPFGTADEELFAALVAVLGVEEGFTIYFFVELRHCESADDLHVEWRHLSAAVPCYAFARPAVS